MSIYYKIVKSDYKMTEHIDYCKLSNETVVSISGNVGGFGGCSHGVCDTVVVASNTTIDASYFFEECPILQEVSLGEKCSFRGDNIFAGCSSLKTLNASNGFRLVGNATFTGCGFRELVIRRGTIIDGNYSFGECLGLVSVIIEDGVVISGDETFKDCLGLVSVVIGNGVVISGHDSFLNCPRLIIIHIGNDVQIQGNRTFAQCGEYYLTIPSQKPDLIEIGHGVVIRGNETFKNCHRMSIVCIGHRVQILGNETFANCERLETLRVGDDFTMTGKDNVAGCRNISTSTHGKNISYTDDSYRINA